MWINGFHNYVELTCCKRDDAYIMCMRSLLIERGLVQGYQFRTVPASNPIHLTPLFHTGKNTGRTGQFRAIPAGTEKSFFFFFF